MNVIIDGLITAGLIFLAIRYQRLRKPIGWLFAVIFVVVIAGRLAHH